MELKDKNDGIDFEKLTDHELSVFKYYNRIIYNKHGD